LPASKSQARSQGGCGALQVGQAVQFSEERFHQYLLNFIVADDQVRLYFFAFFTCVILIFPCSGSSHSMSWNVLNSGISFSFYEMTSTSLIGPSCTSWFSKLGKHILKSCAVTSKYVSLIFSDNYSHFFLIQAAVGQVSFTLDTWSDQKRRHYLAITAHWIAEAKGTLSLRLKVALIAFHQLGRNLSGQSIARTVRHLLDRAGVTRKVR
jgi:hypothetical protein